MSDTQRQDRLVTVKSAMQQLSIGTTTAYKYISMGVLEAVKLSPRSRRIKQSSIDRLIEHGLPQQQEEVA